MAPIPGDSSKHQFGTSMPQGGHPPHHSITSSARASSVGGASSPSVFAVFRLINSQTQITFDNRSFQRWHTEAVGSSAQIGLHLERPINIQGLLALERVRLAH